MPAKKKVVAETSLAGHAQTITFAEPTPTFVDQRPQRMGTAHRNIRNKAEALLVDALNARQKLRELQGKCQHPSRFVASLPGNWHQCTLCGYQRTRSFGS